MIVITGASGRLGGQVARLLDGENEMRLVVRDAARAPALDAEVAVASYRDFDAVRRALAEADVVFMVSGAEDPNRVAQHRNFVDAAAAAGVGHLVYTSFVGAAPDSVFTLARDHWATEEHIRASGLPYTFLRDNLYADFLPMLAGDDGVIRGPAGDGRAALVAQADIAAAAVAVLRSLSSGAGSSHVGRTYDLTGPEAVSLAEAAATITEVTGRPTRFHNETLEEAYASRASYGAPGWQVDAWVSTYTSIAAGELAAVSDDIGLLTGRPPMSLRELLSPGR
jgi:NAD(P)H dehydrogenase (quinone)